MRDATQVRLRSSPSLAEDAALRRRAASSSPPPQRRNSASDDVPQARQRNIIVCIADRSGEDTLALWRWVAGRFIRPSDDRVTLLHARIPGSAGHWLALASIGSAVHARDSSHSVHVHGAQAAGHHVVSFGARAKCRSLRVARIAIG